MEKNSIEEDSNKKELHQEEPEPGMTAGVDQSQSDRPASKLYGVPRRFDLMTLMIVTLAYSLLFSSLQLLYFPPLAFASVAGFITTVALAQALLFKGKRPRIASLFAGFVFTTIYAVVSTIIILQHNWPFSFLVLLIAVCCLGISGIPFGYLAGGLVAGIFLLIDEARKLQSKLMKRKK